MEKITSASNPAVKRLRSLSEARSRRAENAFLVEGGVMINEALESGLKPLEALFEEEEALVSRLASLGASVRLCSRAVLEHVCDTVTPQGCCASFRLPENTAPDEDAARLIALDDVQDPGNVGTILRTADAAGYQGVLLGLKSADVFSPKVQRAAMGSGFRVHSVRTALMPALKAYQKKGYRIVSSALDGEDLYAFGGFGSGERFVLVIGNEAKGISGDIREMSDVRLKIPMRGRAESLNASVAAGILMYELTKPT